MMESVFGQQESIIIDDNEKLAVNQAYVPHKDFRLRGCDAGVSS